MWLAVAERGEQRHNGQVTDGSSKVGGALRFLASGGWADQGAEVVADLLKQAHELASEVMADDDASPKTRSIAQSFLERLNSDTLG